MSAPWLKFYPSDWRADPALRMCSIAARGLWMEMLCIMHEATPRGSLRINGRAVTDKQIATLAGIHDAASLLVEMEEAGVFSREEDGTIYSRRMMRDEEKAAQDKANGKQGGNPTLKQGVNPPDKAQIPDTRSQAEKKDTSPPVRSLGTRIPEDFSPDIEWAVTQGLSSSQAQFEAAQFIDYWRTKPGKEALKLDWPGTWRMWVRNAIKRSTGPPKKRGYADVAIDKLSGQANGSESVFGSHGDAQRISPGLIESRPDDAHLRGGIGGRFRPSDN